MPRKDKVIHISNLPSTFRGNVTRNGRNIPQKQYATGGKVPNVVAGGIAQPLGNNFFYMNGRKHSQGGIDIGPSDKTGIEVEGGEVVETNGNELKVYSAQPILNGISPAKLVMGGANPNKVFKAQEDFKDRNGINDDGSKATYGKEKENEGLFTKIDDYANKAINYEAVGYSTIPAGAALNLADTDGINNKKKLRGKDMIVSIIKKNNYNKNDNTTVAKPVIQEYIPATGSTKFIQDLRNKLTRNNTIKGGNINIVSPEFDILTGIRGIANTFNNIINKYIGRKLPKNYAYRRTLQQELDDIINNNVFRKIPNNITVPKGKTFTTSSGKKISLHKAGGNSHGGKAFSAGKVWDGTSSSGNKSKEIIIGVPGENAEWMVGHHGSYKGPYKFNDIEQGSGLFVPFDENNIANISTNGLRAYKPSIFNNRYIPIELDKKRMGGLSKDKDYGSKKKPYPSVAKKDFAGGHRSYPIPTKADAIDALRLAGLHGRNDVKAKVYNKYPELRKKGSNGLIISISGNVKNGLLHSPSSTGGLRDKFAVGGDRINRHGRTWEYDEQIGAYVPITNRTINRTSAYPINKSARGETIVGSDYTFRNGRWSKNNTTNNNTNKSNIDNGNRRPQYYAERRLPLFEDGAGITSGLVRAGWSHGNNKDISMNNTNIPSLSATKSSGKTPRRGRSKSSQSTQSVPTKILPTAVYNRNLPKVEASIPTTLPVSTNIPAKGTTSSDGKGQGRFKNITTADWIGLGSNVAGSLASYFASRRAINKMRGPGQPTLISANKLKTKYNINPQLDRIREDKFEAYRDIDSNTASSRVSLARKQRVRNAAGQAANELYGNKENIETNLINQDRRNQQSVRQFNAQQYNQYIDRKTAFDNDIREAKLTNVNNLFTGINAGIQDMISRYENRKALNNTISAMRASAPNVDDRIMRDAGVDYDEFVIRKRRKLGGK